MKIALLGTQFGQARAAVYAQRADVDQVVVFGRTPDKLATISDRFGFATTTDLSALIADPLVDLVDTHLPNGRCSAADVVLGYPRATARCSSSALMPRRMRCAAAGAPPSQVRCSDTPYVPGSPGHGPATLTESTANGENPIDLSAASSYETMIDRRTGSGRQPMMPRLRRHRGHVSAYWCRAELDWRGGIGEPRVAEPARSCRARDQDGLPDPARVLAFVGPCSARMKMWSACPRSRHQPSRLP